MLRTQFLALALLFGAFALSGVYSSNTQAHALEADTPEVLAVILHADWCGYCQELGPKLMDVKPEFKEQPVLFVEFDVTDDFTTRQTELLAEWIGLDGIYQQHEGNTGYVLLLDPETLDEIARVTHDLSQNEIRATIAGTIE